MDESETISVDKRQFELLVSTAKDVAFCDLSKVKLLDFELMMIHLQDALQPFK